MVSPGAFFLFFFFDPSLAFYARSHQIKLTPVPRNRGAVTKQCTKPPPPPPRPCRTSCSPPFIALIRFLFLSVPVAWVELRVGPPWGAGHCTPRRSQRERSGPLPGLAFGDSGWSPEVLRGGGGGGEASPRCPEGARRPSGKGPWLAQAGWGGRGCRCVSRGAPSGWSRWPPSVHLGSPSPHPSVTPCPPSQHPVLPPGGSELRGASWGPGRVRPGSRGGQEGVGPTEQGEL